MFYILRDGELSLETVIEYEQNVKYPIDAKCWEIKRTTKTMQYHIRHLAQGDYFGHEEILAGHLKRQTRVKCLTQARILYINKADLFQQFW